MERNNMLTIGVVAVVIVVVLAGTYLYFRDDGGDNNGLIDLELGDKLSMANIEIVGGEETRYLSEMYAAATINGNMYFVYQSNIGDYKVIAWDMSDPVLIDTDVTIEDIYGNEIVCDLYSVERSGEEAYVYIDKMGPVVMTHTISDDGTTEKWSYNLSTRDDVHIGSSTVDYDMEAGDTLVYLWQEKGNIYNPETAVTMYVTSCEDGVLTYYNEFRGEEMTTTPENFVSFGEDYEGESKGQAVYYNLSYGYRLCNVYHIEDERGSQTLIVGAEDGVCYYIRMVVDGVTYGGELAYASMVSGDYPTKDRTEEGIGDWSSTMHVTVDADGNRTTHIDYERVNSVTDGVNTTEVYDNSGNPSHAGDGEIADPVVGSDNGTNETLYTVYGTLDCDIYVLNTENYTIKNWVYDGITMQSRTDYADGSYEIRTLFFYTPIDYDGTSQLEADNLYFNSTEVGTWFEYSVYSPEGDYMTDARAEITAIDEDGTITVILSSGMEDVTQVLTEDDQNLDLDILNSVIIDTAWGERACYRCAYSGPYGEMILYVGIDNRIIYQGDVDLANADYDVVMKLESSSSVF